MDSLKALSAWLEAQEQDPRLEAPARLRQRIAVLDRLDEAFGAELGAVHADGAATAVGLGRRALALRSRLEAVNERLYQRLRERIRGGVGSAALRRWVDQCGAGAPIDGDGYDERDELIGGVLRFAAPAAPVVELAADMVFYQPTPARHVFDLLDRLALGEADVLVDLGSGLGHVPLLGALCTPARCVGVELEPSHVASARGCAAALQLARVAFVEQDARDWDFSIGTAFYLYTPFSGAILRTVLEALRRQAACRAIRVCTYGPCTPIVGAEPWLEVVGTVEAGRVALFRSR